MHYTGPTADGYVFMAPSSGPGQRGVMILDHAGDIVWFHPTTPNTAMNFRPGRLHGKPVLTWWEGKADRGLGRGTHVIVDQSYRQIARIPAGDGRQSDLHEFLITPHNTAIITSYEVRDVDLRPVGGPSSGKVIGGLVQELALPSGRVLFEWRSLDHVAIDETHAPYTGHALDYFHVNSVDLGSDGDLLISARNTWGLYKVSRTTGKVLWRLGGKRSTFEMGAGTGFAWQHDARHHGNGLISVFDNGGMPFVQPQARALLIQLDGKRLQATLARKYTHRPGRVRSRFMGNAQLLGNGNLVVGWGSEPFVTEFARDGHVLMDMRLPKGGMTYRAFRLPWHGHPAVKPAVEVRGRWVYVSWNGATDVRTWQLEAGPSAGELQVAARVRKEGFETRLPRPAGSRAYLVTAFDAAGKPLGRATAS
jgi:hypothetical protein